jgi:hypothetical protein
MNGPALFKEIFMNDDSLNFDRANDAAQNAARYLLMRSMIAGGRGQDLFEEFCMDGAKPTAKQIDAAMDKLLLAAGRR